MRLEDDQIEALRRWGEALREAGDEELAPAGRAILMLLEEVARLRLELASTRREPPRREDPASTEAVADTGEALASTLRDRLQRSGERATPSPEAWIESLRQHE